MADEVVGVSVTRVLQEKKGNKIIRELYSATFVSFNSRNIPRRGICKNGSLIFVCNTQGKHCLVTSIFKYMKSPFICMLGKTGNYGSFFLPWVQ